MPSHRLSDILPHLPDHQSSSRRPKKRCVFIDSDDDDTESPSEPYKVGAAPTTDISEGRPSWHHAAAGPSVSTPRTDANDRGDRNDGQDVNMDKRTSPTAHRRLQSLALPPPPPPATSPGSNQSLQSSRTSAMPSVRSPVSAGSHVFAVDGGTGPPAATSASMPSGSSSASRPGNGSPSTPETPLNLKGISPVPASALSKSGKSKRLKEPKPVKKTFLSISTTPNDLMKAPTENPQREGSTSSKVIAPPISGQDQPSQAVSAAQLGFRPARTAAEVLWTRKRPRDPARQFYRTFDAVNAARLDATNNGNNATPTSNEGKAGNTSNIADVPKGILAPAQRKSKDAMATNVASKDVTVQTAVPSTSLPTADVAQAVQGPSSSRRGPTNLPNVLTSLRTELEALWEVLPSYLSCLYLLFPPCNSRVSTKGNFITEFAAAQRATQAAENERDNLKQKLKVAEKDAESTKTQLEGARAIITGLEHSVQVELCNTESAHSMFVASRAELERTQKEMKALQTQLDQARSETQRLKTQVNTLEAELGTLRLTLKITQERKQWLEQKNQALVRDHIQAQALAKEHAAEGDRRVETIKTLQAGNDKLKQEIADMRQRSERQTKDEQSRVEDLSATNLRLREEIDVAKRNLETQAHVLSLVRKEHAVVTIQLQQSRSQVEGIIAESEARSKKLLKEHDDKMLEFARLQTEHARSIELAQQRLDDNTRLRTTCSQLEEKIRAKDQAHDALVNELRGEVESRRKACEALESKAQTLESEVEAQIKQMQARASEYKELEGERESLEVELMTALEKRIREEESHKAAEEMAKICAEKEAEVQRLNSEIAKLQTQNAQLVSSPSKILGKRTRPEPKTERDWRKYAEEVGETFFDPEGVCIACRRVPRNGSAPIPATFASSQEQIEHVWIAHQQILPKHREESKKVSKRPRRDSVRARARSSSVIVL